MKKYLAERFQKFGTGMSLNTEAIRKYKDIIDLSIGDTDITTDEEIIDAALTDAKSGFTHYGNPKGDTELISAVCKAWADDYRENITPDNVIITASSCLGMALVLFAVLNPNDEVIVFSPYFSIYKRQIEIAGGVCTEVQTHLDNDFSINEEDLRKAVNGKTKAIILNNPVNPTGKVYEKDEIELIAKIAQEYDLLVIADEIYTHYLYQGSFTPFRMIKGMADRTITLNSFSKNFLMAGWRIGLIIAHPDIIKAINYVNGSFIYAAPSVSQRAGLKALNIRERIKKQYIEVYKNRVSYAADRIKSIPWLKLMVPKGTFYLFPAFNIKGMTSREFCNLLLEKAHVLVSPGELFGKSGEGHFRIACTVDESRLKEAFDRMEKLF